MRNAFEPAAEFRAADDLAPSVGFVLLASRHNARQPTRNANWHLHVCHSARENGHCSICLRITPRAGAAHGTTPVCPVRAGGGHASFRFHQREDGTRARSRTISPPGKEYSLASDAIAKPRPGVSPQCASCAELSAAAMAKTVPAGGKHSRSGAVSHPRKIRLETNAVWKSR